MKKIRIDIIIAFLLLVFGILFYFKKNMAAFGICVGIFIALMNSILVYFSTINIGKKTKNMFKYLVETFLFRMPLLAALMYVFLVKLKAGIFEFGLGITLGFVYGVFSMSKKEIVQCR